MANKQLTAKVKLNTTQAEKSIDNLVKKINKINDVVNKTNSAQTKMTSGLQRNNTLISKIGKGFGTWSKVLNPVLSIVKKIASALVGIATIKMSIQGADTLTGAENRLNNIAGKQLGASAYTYDSSGNKTGYSTEALNYTQEAMDKMYAASKRARTSYSDMMTNVSKTMTLASDAFKGNIDNAIRFQEVMSKAYAVGGASATEMSTSMYQLTQALGSGVLQGDELRSVREGAPLAYQAIEKFAQGVLHSTDSLKDLASEGKITSEMVVAAIMDMGSEVDQAFALTKWRFSEVFASIISAGQRAFQPVVSKLTEMLNKAVDNGLIEKSEKILTNIANMTLIAMEAIERFTSFISRNIDVNCRELLTLATILGGVLLGYLILNLITGKRLIKMFIIAKIEAVKAAIASAISWMSLCWPLTLIILLLAAIVIAVIWTADSFADACGMIVGAIMVAVAFVWNLVVGVINAIIQFLWTAFVEPWIGIVEYVLNVFNGGFNSFGDGVKNLLSNIISWFLSLGKVVTKIIDAIFGTNWTGGLESLKSSVLEWGKNENAITLDRTAPDLNDFGDAKWSYGDAYSSGYDWGTSGANWISDKLSLDNLGSKLGLDLSKTGNFQSASGSTLNPDDYNKYLGDIAGDTGKIADSMELSEEDLEYLRRVAEKEWESVYTTHEIKLDVTNNNHINSELDIFGIANKLTEVLYEEADYVPNGVYVG